MPGIETIRCAAQVDAAEAVFLSFSKDTGPNASGKTPRSDNVGIDTGK
jgi:hypothetical protein